MAGFMYGKPRQQGNGTLKTIWLINQYASLPQMGQGGRHRHLARELAARGHNVSLVAARWTHYVSDSYNAEEAPEIEDFEGFRFVRISVPRYAGAHDKRRILNWFLFALRLRRLPALLNEKPDVILYSSPSLVGFLGAARLARRSGARLVFEVRDIWPLTLIDIGGYSAGHPFIRFLQWIEDRAYARSERVVSNLPGAVEHMVGRGMERNKFAWVPNGFSVADMGQDVPLSQDVRDRIPTGKFVVGYTGTMGAANSLITLIDAAEKLRNHEDIVFVLVGRGQEKASLQSEIKRRGLSNIVLVDPVEKTQVQSVLALFDACYIGWRREGLYNFGVAPNKIFDYFYAAKPVINSYSGGHDPISAYNAGITIPAEDADALAQAVLDLKAMPEEERRRLGENGRAAVMLHHEYANLAAQLEQVLLGESDRSASKGLTGSQASGTYSL